MGFYYSATVGYGVLIPESELTPFLKKFEGLWEGDDFDLWFKEHGPWNVEYKFINNEPEGWLFFYIPDTYDSGEAREENGAVPLSNYSKEDEESLGWVANTIGVSADHIGWHHIWSAN